MLTLHITQTEETVTIPKAEFMKLIDTHNKIEPIQVIEDDDSEHLTEEDLQARAEAMEELENGKTIPWSEMKNELAAWRADELSNRDCETG